MQDSKLDGSALAFRITAYVEVFVEHPRFEHVFLDRVRALDEVQECHYVTGEFSVLLKIRARDIERLQQLLLREINATEGVRQTRTSLVLSTVKEESFVPSGAPGDLP